jgi:hypothetical protein
MHSNSLEAQLRRDRTDLHATSLLPDNLLSVRASIRMSKMDLPVNFFTVGVGFVMLCTF